MTVRPVSVIVAALNEAETIETLLRTLARQSVLPEEVVVADGGSTDRTPDIVQRLADELPYKVTVLTLTGKVACGRNAAISASRNNVVAVTDADCRPSDRWLEFISDPILEGRAQAVAGGYVAVATDSLQRAIATFSWVPLDEKKRRFLPSHRSVAFAKSVWSEIGGYNEKIDSGEDTKFDLDVEKAFGWCLAPEAQVAWRPRSSVGGAIWQQLFYGAGDGQAKNLIMYHGAVALFVLAEVLVVFSGGMIRGVAALVVGSITAYFLLKHARLFRVMLPDATMIVILALILPPSRLVGFLIGLFGGSLVKWKKRA